MAVGGKNCSILIVEDDEQAIELYARLISEGYCCFEAHNAPKAIELLNVDPIDIAILDMAIQNTSGEELLQSLVHKYTNTSIIATSDTVVLNVVIHCMKN